MLLIYLSCAWVAGVFIGSKLSMPAVFVCTGLIPLIALPFFRNYWEKIVLASLCIFVLFGGAIRFQLSLPIFDERQLQYYNDKGTVELKGLIYGDPEIKDRTTHLRLSTNAIKTGDEWRKVSGSVLIFAPRYAYYKYGDVLKLTGKLETPPKLDEFDYQGYLANQGIYSTMLYPRIELLETGKGLNPLEWVYSVRNHMSEALGKVLPEPHTAFAKGIVLGLRGTIPDEINTSMSFSGTTHIMAISGLNLSIVAGILLSLCIWLFGRRRHIHIWVAMAMIWLYTVLTGMNPPVIRAAIMTSLFLVTELLGRQRSAMTSLAFAAAIMIGVTPQVLWQTSFQMSFLAMVGLIIIAPIFMEIGRKIINNILGENGTGAPSARFVTDSLSVSLGAVLAVVPLIAYYFGIVSFVAPVATFLSLPVLSGVIVIGALTGGIGIVALPVAQVIGWVLWLLISYMLLIINGFAELPGSHLEVVSVNLAPVTGYYIVLTVALWLNSRRKRLTSLIPETADFLSRIPMRLAVVPLIVMAILVSFTAATMPDDKLHVSFLDVGEGDSILIQSPAHQDILIDGGPSPQAVCTGLSDKMPFWDRTIDLVILTHPHADHLTGLIEVLKRYKVNRVLAPDANVSSPIYDEWGNTIKTKNIKYTTALAGQQIELGKGALLKILNPTTPPITGTGSDADNNGTVVRIEMGKVSFMFTADIWQDAELELIHQRAVVGSTVLKVAHHGSDTSTSDEFLAVANPQMAIISAGTENRFGHPSDEVLNRLEQRLGKENIYRTDQHGTVEFITNGERMWVRTKL